MARGVTTPDRSRAHLISVRDISATSNVQKLVLQVSREFNFQAGQYLQIVHPTGELIPLSIATAPHRLPELHLHYQSTSTPEAALIDGLLMAFEQGAREIDVRDPSGEVVLDAALRQPLLLIAGGTGAAQAASFIDQLTFTPPPYDVTLLLCADTENDLYLRQWLEALDAPWLKTTLIADTRRTQENDSLIWLTEHAHSLTTHRIVLSGSPGFVYAATDTLTRSAIPESSLESDVFSYAPRS